MPDGKKVWTQYAHLQSIVKYSGQVTRGQQIGTVGNANGAWCAHLHFEIRKKYRAPNAWVAGWSKAQVLDSYYDPSNYITNHRKIIVGNKKTTIGLYDQNAAKFYLRNSNTAGVGEINFSYGSTAVKRIPVTGDWNGDGKTTIGLYDPNTAKFYLRNSNTSGVADKTFSYGSTSVKRIPVTGDWNGDGKTTIGLYDQNTAKFFLRNSNTAGVGEINFTYGSTSVKRLPVTGAWR